MARRLRRAAGAAMVAALAAGGLALGSLGLGSVAGAQTPPDLHQGWGDQQRASWYSLSQGSRLVPLAWLTKLERPDGGGLFLEDGYFARFHYRPMRPDSAGNRLPPGFVTDTTSDGRLKRTALRWTSAQPDGAPWVGMNCSACHTAQIAYTPKGAAAPVVMTVEGGPTGADFQSLISELNSALTLTLNPPASEPDRFDKFARAVLGPAYPQDRGMLKTALAAVVARQSDIARQNTLPGGYHYGYGRLDAIGNIFNKVAVSASTRPTPAPPQAPVSYPFLWNVPQHDKVQWNGIAPNDRGALLPMLRNGGEVIGVFADIDLTKPVFLNLPAPYRSSVNVENLKALEEDLWSLQPPAWPQDTLGKYDELFGKDPAGILKPGETLVDNGRTAYAAHCKGCHALLPGGREDLASPITAQMFRFVPQEPPPGQPKRLAPGTDIWMACNAVTRTSDSGVLKGTYYAGPITGLPQQANVSDMLLVTVVGTLINQGVEVLQALKDDLLGGTHQQVLQPIQPKVFFGLFSAPASSTPSATSEASRADYCRKTSSDLLAYKARPLYGVWATAPFLHNGSVPTLWDLMLPQDRRPTSFSTGTRDFDPERVGFVTTPSADNSFLFQVADASGPIPGNSNLGHDYRNSEMSDVERWAIIAYIKAGLPET